MIVDFFPHMCFLLYILQLFNEVHKTEIVISLQWIIQFGSMKYLPLFYLMLVTLNFVSDGNIVILALFIEYIFIFKLLMPWFRGCLVQIAYYYNLCLFVCLCAYVFCIHAGIIAFFPFVLTYSSLLNKALAML